MQATTAFPTRLLVLLIVALAGSAPSALQEASGNSLDESQESAATEVLFPDSWLVLSSVDDRGRRPFRPDHVFERHLLDVASAAPVAGQVLRGERDEEQAWSLLTTTDEDRSVGGASWAFSRVVVESDRVVLAQLTGASTLFVNGDGFVGDAYSYGFGGVPVALRRGVNQIFVTGIRGSFTLTFEDVDPGLHVGGWDATLPDLLAGEPLPAEAGVFVYQAGTEWARDVQVHLSSDGEATPRSPSAFDLAPLAVGKLPAPLVAPPGFRLPTGKSMAWSAEVSAAGQDGDGARVERATELNLALRPRGATHRRTSRSRIDDTVQEWSLVPPSDSSQSEGPVDPEGGPGLVLSLHGAGVTSLRQANCYIAKPDLWVAAPLNRRPFGFDWQDWGRIDAYETLAAALALSGVAQDRVYLTGHSMGGHGTWHLAANDADRFAAIAPSAGWESFDSYGGRPDGSLRELWHRADGSSQTLGLLSNLVQLPIFVLHGSKDETVPLSEAETMLAALKEAGHATEHHFEQGAGHWWGNACVDWPGITELFRRHRRPQDPERLDFLTVDPVIDHRHHWLEVAQSQEYGRPVRVRASFDRAGGVLATVTENAAALRFDLPTGWNVSRYEIDGRSFDAMGVLDRAEFRREGERWRRGRPPAGQKSPERSGPFKRAFDRSFVFVVGTQGSDRESAELLARARYDASVWWYRGNGFAPIVLDTEWDSAAEPERNVILYGNRDSNSAWARALATDGPLDAERGKIRLGDETFEGGDLAAVFVAPRRGSEAALVGVFADSGAAGTRLGYTLAPFVSGVGYPDYAVFSAEVLRTGDGGVLSAGWFGRDWEL